MVRADETVVARKLGDLADQLTASGHLRSAPWRKAFLSVRRHVFVPRFWRDLEPGAFPARWHMVDSATSEHDDWLDTVYSDRTLATELTGVPAVNGPGMHPQVTSSSTMPSLVMAMLEDLAVTDDMNVLEIGTGTGYNAALLCARLGDAHVTSIDINPELVALARVRLAEHGYHPHLVAGDGADGASDRGPFDRIIATCGLHEIPGAWIRQTAERGKILLNVLGPFNQHALLRLDVHAGRVSGRFVPQSGGFMPRRTDSHIAFDPVVRIDRVDDDITTRSTTRLDPTLLYRDPSWGLVCQSSQPLRSRQICLDEDCSRLATEIATTDGRSWALVHHDPDPRGRHTVEQSGRQHLWDEIEQHHRTWRAHGEPAYDEIDVEVDPDTSRITLQLDPSHGQRLHRAPSS